MNVALGVLLICNIVSGVVNITIGNDNRFLGYFNLAVACFLAVVLGIEMVEG